jgi:diguanylate cyclase (GGDEF)-like protein/PAS domain S-box-containing protein
VKIEATIFYRLSVLAAATFLLSGIGVKILQWYGLMESIPLHVALETSGSFIALFFSFFIYKFDNNNNYYLSRFHYVSLSLIAIAVIGLFHAISVPGAMFVWLYTTGMFVGSILMLTVFLPERSVSYFLYTALPLISAVISVIIAALLFTVGDTLPDPIINGHFSNSEIFVSNLSALFFFLASIPFAYHYRQKKQYEDVYFFALALLLSAASFLFQYSMLWGATWWYWHFIRLSGFFFLLLYFIRFIEEKNQLFINREIQSSIIEFSADAIITKSMDGLILTWNAAAESLFGYTADEVIGKSAAILYSPSAASMERENIRQIREGASFKQFEAVFVAKNGVYVDVAVTLSPIKDSSNTIIGISKIVRDITERKKATEAFNRLFLRNEAILDSVPDIIMQVDNDKKYIWANKSGIAFFGEDVIGKEASYYFEGEQDTYETTNPLFDGDQNIIYVESFQKRYDGEIRLLAWWCRALNDENGHPIGALSTAQDITEHKKSERELRKLSQAIEQSPNSVIITDSEANIEYVNAAFTAATGYTLDDVIGKNPRFFQSGKTSPSAYTALWDQLREGKSWHGEFINKGKDGTEFIEEVKIAPIFQTDGSLSHYMAIKDDITEKKHTEERVHYLANYDLLTGLPNRAQLIERITYFINVAKRHEGEFAVMFLDLDHFKDINDMLGHSIGDILLVELAKRIQSTIREEDTVSRLGGDEFIFILPSTSVHGVAHVVEKLFETITKPFSIEQNELIVTASIGIAIYPIDGADPETLLKNADTAMYQAKQNGRNNYRFFTKAMQETLARNIQLTNALRHALEKDQLHVVYQPQVAITDAHIIGAEALLRWNHPELGAISPAEFIPLAEESGLILPIGEWVLRTAVTQAKGWIDSGFPPIIVAVNLSAVQFRHPHLPELVTTILEDIGLPPEYLELELTEAVAMHDPKSAYAIMDNLHDRGIRMSIDDFGTGYSSLSYLKKFKVYKLKIDQSFIRDISTDPEDKAIVNAVISMAHSLGLKAIAEGVETVEQLKYLREQGCDEVQGYYFSKPLNSESFNEFITIQSKKTMD